MSGDTVTDQALDRARYWLDLGVTTIPAFPRSKRPQVNWAYWQTHTPTDYHLREWFSNGANLAVLCGGQAHLAVVDFDRLADYYVWRKDHGAAAHTHTVRTRRGMHVYFFTATQPMTHLRGDLLVKGQGGYVLAPPSTHPSGTPYRSMNGDEILYLESLEEVLPPATRRVGKWIVPESVTDRPGFVAWLKEQLSIVELVNHYTECRPSSPDCRWWVARCPFHDDHNPSFWLDNVRGTCNCFVPGCKAERPMDIFNFYARMHRMSNEHAIDELGEKII